MIALVSKIAKNVLYFLILTIVLIILKYAINLKGQCKYFTTMLLIGFFWTKMAYLTELKQAGNIKIMFE